jgi:alkanesulfonate monooxygenase SsuD/methylene tetrahydromethanopterin reductase-like flavin-dependent oxidoreductase (luciferase family)
MNVGMMMVFASYGWENCPDARVWDEEIRLARLAADLGFDCLWSAEHHFNDYSFVPDNFQLLTYLTALCPNVDLGTAAVIVPWHDPLRVAEQAAVLDMLSQGRLRLGLGRGLARREFAAFRLSGMPYDVAERGLKLFATEVLPVLQAEAPAAARPAAE